MSKRRHVIAPQQSVLHFIRLVWCLLFALSLPGCAETITLRSLSPMTLHALSALNTNAYATQICAHPPGVPEDTRLFTYNYASNSFTSDHDPAALQQSAYSADLILEYNPLAPPSSAKLLPISMGVFCPTRVAISTEVHAELSESVEQTCKVAALEGTARQYVGQHVGTTPIVLGRNNPQFEARVRKLLGLEKIPEPSPAEPAPAEARLRQIGDSIVDFGRGAVAEVPLTFVPGGSIGADLAIQGKLLPEGTRAARIGRGVVDLGVGVGQIIVGCGGTIGGIGLSGTGGGAIAGVPMTVGSLTLVVTGFANAGIGARRLTIEILRKDGGDGAGSSELPPQTSQPPQASPPAAKPPQQPPSVAKPAQASRGVSAETTTTTRNKATGETVTRKSSGTTTTTQAKPPPGTQSATSTNYRETFFAAHPAMRDKVVVHHGVEQQVLEKYPGLFTEAEIHSLTNLRGIPSSINSELHLSKIRLAWNRFYKSHPTATKQDVLDFAAELDKKFGAFFNPPR
jgi:hypothetical protein